MLSDFQENGVYFLTNCHFAKVDGCILLLILFGEIDLCAER